MGSKGADTVVVDTLRAVMSELDLSEVRLAEASGMARQTLARRLSGATSFTVNELARIAAVVGKTTSDFFTEDAA